MSDSRKNAQIGNKPERSSYVAMPTPTSIAAVASCRDDALVTFS